jgi:hypothetical protein
MYDGVNRLSVLGASGDPNVPGLGFRFDMDKERWSIPNPIGLPGVFEGYCPPHYKNMREAVEALAKRKFGEGGVYNPNTPGLYTLHGVIVQRLEVVQSLIARSSKNV